MVKNWISIKTSLKSVFSPDKQRKAELALQNYKSRQSSIASSRGWGAEEITKKNKTPSNNLKCHHFLIEK